MTCPTDTKRFTATDWLRLVLGALLLCVCGYFLLHFTRRLAVPDLSAEEVPDISEWATLATPSMFVLGLAMGLGLFLLGLRVRGRALELLPALMIAVLAMLLSRAPIFWGVYSKDRSEFAKQLQQGALEASLLGLLLFSFLSALRDKDRGGFSWKAALWPVLCVLLIILIKIGQYYLMQQMVRGGMNVSPYVEEEMRLRYRRRSFFKAGNALLSLVAALGVMIVCNRPHKAAAWTLLGMGTVGVVLYVLSYHFPVFLANIGSETGEMIRVMPFPIKLIKASTPFGSANADGNTLYLSWLCLGLKGLLPLKKAKD